MSAEIVTVDLLVDGGNASSGGAMGPALGPLGVNIKQIVDEINKKTSAYQGMKVPVVVTVNKATRAFELDIGIPPASALVLKAAGISKGSSTPNTEIVGNINFPQLIEITKSKMSDLAASNLKFEREGVQKVYCPRCLNILSLADCQSMLVWFHIIDYGSNLSCVAG